MGSERGREGTATAPSAQASCSHAHRAQAQSARGHANAPDHAQGTRARMGAPVTAQLLMNPSELWLWRCVCPCPCLCLWLCLCLCLCLSGFLSVCLSVFGGGDEGAEVRRRESPDTAKR